MRQPTRVWLQRSEGLVAHKLGQNIEIIGLPLHPDVQSYLDAHTAYALKGWEEELAFLGYTGAGAEPAFSQARASRAAAVNRSADGRGT